MNYFRKFSIFFLLCIFLTSCTVGHYKVRNESADDPSNAQLNFSTPISYSISIESAAHTNSFGPKEDNDRQISKLSTQYKKSTESVLNKLGLENHYVENEEEANFIVKIKRQPSLSALPQEWLTGLSLGLIPSGGTRPSQFIYTFDNKKTQTSFAVDQVTYNHLIFFPVFWVSFMTLNELNCFEDTLETYIKGS